MINSSYPLHQTTPKELSLEKINSTKCILLKPEMVHIVNAHPLMSFFSSPLPTIAWISHLYALFFLLNEGRCLSCRDRWQLWSQSSSWCSLGCSQWWRCKKWLTIPQRCLCSFLDESFYIFVRVLMYTYFFHSTFLGNCPELMAFDNLARL